MVVYNLGDYAKNLPAGKWTLETFASPRAGKTTKSQPVMSASGRTLKMPLPRIEWDELFDTL